jgi:hypothetical protein
MGNHPIGQLHHSVHATPASHQQWETWGVEPWHLHGMLQEVDAAGRKW